MDDRLSEWTSRYATAWENADPSAAAALFTEDATYRSHIFKEPHFGRAAINEYWRAATASQSDVSVRFGEPLTTDARAVVEWWTTMTDTDDGQEVTLPGVLILDFDDELCTALREYWALGEGHSSPPPNWGRIDREAGDTAELHAQSYADGYAGAWPKFDVEAIVSLFDDDALYCSHPLKPPHRRKDGVRTYTQAAFGDESEVDCGFSVVAAEGGTAAVEYWAVMKELSEPTTLAGCDLVGFSRDGLCRELREYWHMKAGRHDPPSDWGR